MYTIKMGDMGMGGGGGGIYIQLLLVDNICYGT